MKFNVLESIFVRGEVGGGGVREGFTKGWTAYLLSDIVICKIELFVNQDQISLLVLPPPPHLQSANSILLHFSEVFKTNTMDTSEKLVNICMSPVPSYSVRKRKASMLERSSGTALPIHLSKSAPDNHAISNSSSVRQEMIQSIKSLDDMLISSYRASLSHHSYSRFSQSDKTNGGTEGNVIFVDEAEDAQLGIEDVGLSNIVIDQDKTQRQKKEKITVHGIECCSHEGTSAIPVHKFYQENKKMSNKNNSSFSRSTVKQIVKTNNSDISVQPRVSQSSSGASQVNSTYIRGRTSFGYQHKTPNDHNANFYPNLNSRESADELPSNKPSYVVEDGLVINTNVKGLSAHSRKMSTFLHLLYSIFDLLCDKILNLVLSKYSKKLLCFESLQKHSVNGFGG